MRSTYKPQEEISEASKKVGRKIVNLLVEAGISYQEADDALTVAQDELAKATTPIYVTESPR